MSKQSSKLFPQYPHKSARRSWERHMVINNIALLPTKLKLKEIVMTLFTWCLWLLTIYHLVNHGDDILLGEIKFGYSGLELLLLLGVIFAIQLTLSFVWSRLILPKSKRS